MRETGEHSPIAGRPPRDDHFLFGDPSEAQPAPDFLHGLRPRHLATTSDSTGSLAEWSQRTMRGGLPLLMTGSLAAGVGVTSAMPAVAEPHTQPVPAEGQVQRMKSSLSELIAQAFVPLSQRVVNTVAPHVPDTYQVRSGDTITSVAEKFGLPTAMLLSLNGLSWNSMLHEGQIVRLTMAPSKQRGMAPPRVTTHGYTTEAGDTLASIATRLGMSEQALANANDLQPGATLRPGVKLVLPGSETQLAPRTVPVDPATPAPRVVLASVTEQAVSEPDNTATTQDQEAQDGESANPTVQANPLDAEILEAPELRPEKKATPPPPPPAPEPPAQKQEQRDDDDDDDDKSEEASDSSVGKPVSGAVTPLNDVRRKNASTIVEVGRDLGVPDYGIVIALATAMQESSLRNIDWGDRDSVGLFQQRPSSGWGSAEQIMDPVFASKAFYGGPSNPNPGRTRGLLDYSGWQSMELTDAAQKVQRSAYPDAYAKWEASAWAWFVELS